MRGATVGAGIGGIALALTLRREDIDFVLLEQARVEAGSWQIASMRRSGRQGSGERGICCWRPEHAPPSVEDDGGHRAVASR